MYAAQNPNNKFTHVVVDSRTLMGAGVKQKHVLGGGLTILHCRKDEQKKKEKRGTREFVLG